MITKHELLRGTKEDFEEYFYKTCGVIKYSERDEHENLVKMYADDNCGMETSGKLSIINQLEDIIKNNKGLGMVHYLKLSKGDDTIDNTFMGGPVPTVKMTLEKKFVFIVDEEKIMEN